MAPLTTDAVVLHAFDYLESSRILRLATREAGMQSVLAKGARRTGRRFGSAVDLFAEGQAQLWLKPGRDLQTLGALDVTRARPALALDLERFAAASAIAELLLRCARDDANPRLYDVLVATLDALAAAPAAEARAVGLAGAWQLVAELGFAPTTDACASCHVELAPDAPAAFSHPSGGALCGACARFAHGVRVLPPEARGTMRAWLRGDSPRDLDGPSLRAHQRLLREFLREHVTETRPLRAFEVWEQGM